MTCIPLFPTNEANRNKSNRQWTTKTERRRNRSFFLRQVVHVKMKRKKNLQFDILLEQPLFVFFLSFTAALTLILVTSTHLAAIDSDRSSSFHKYFFRHQLVGSTKYTSYARLSNIIPTLKRLLSLWKSKAHLRALGEVEVVSLLGIQFCQKRWLKRIFALRADFLRNFCFLAITL